MSKEMLFDMTTGTALRKAQLEPITVRIKTENNKEVVFVVPKIIADMI